MASGSRSWIRFLSQAVFSGVRLTHIGVPVSQAFCQGKTPASKCSISRAVTESKSVIVILGGWKAAEGIPGGV